MNKRRIPQTQKALVQKAMFKMGDMLRIVFV